MSDKEEKGKSEIVLRNIQPLENSLQIGKDHWIDLTGLSEEQKKALKQKYAEKMIDIGTRAAEGGVDTEILDNKLGTIAGHTIAIGKEGGSVTITSTSDDSIGRTEVLMGIRSKAAEEGKLSRSQAGLKDLYPLWIGVGIFIIIVIAIIVKMR